MISTSTTVSAIAAIALAAGANAQTLDFEDLTVSDTFQANTGMDSFVTDGVQVNLTDYEFIDGTTNDDGTAVVQNPSNIGTGNGIFTGNALLDFQLPYPLTMVAFKYDNAGGSTNLRINGFLFKNNDLSLADGFDFGGDAQAMVVGDTDAGMVMISGDIGQFSVGGQEFTIDDVSYVPVPGVGAMAIAPALIAFRRRRA